MRSVSINRNRPGKTHPCSCGIRVDRRAWYGKWCEVCKMDLPHPNEVYSVPSTPGLHRSHRIVCAKCYPKWLQERVRQRLNGKRPSWLTQIPDPV